MTHPVIVLWISQVIWPLKVYKGIAYITSALSWTASYILSALSWTASLLPIFFLPFHGLQVYYIYSICPLMDCKFITYILSALSWTASLLHILYPALSWTASLLHIFYLSSHGLQVYYIYFICPL